MKAITFFEEDREPTPNKPNKIITGIVDDNAEIYISRFEQENKQLKKENEKLLWYRIFNNNKECSILVELEEWLKEKWYEIEPKGTGINFNCEYDSEEDYVRGMETKSKLDTLKNTLNKIQELKEKYK